MGRATPLTGFPVFNNNDGAELSEYTRFLFSEVLTQLSVISRIVTTPPTTPEEGDRYIVGPSATGDWADQDNSIAAFYRGLWWFFAPEAGWTCYIVDETARAEFDGTVWDTFPKYGVIRFVDSTANFSVDTTPIPLDTYDEVGAVKGVTCSVVNGTILILVAGVYEIHFQASFEGSTGVSYELHLRINGVEQSAGCHRYLGTGTDKGSVSFDDEQELLANDELAVFVEANAAGKTFSPIDVQFLVNRIDK